MQELYDRLVQCLASMQVIQNTCMIIKDDFLKRTIGRMFFIRLDDFVKTAPQLKNKLQRAGYKVRTLEERIHRLESDYENHYARIRDHLAAHRDGKDFWSCLELWHDIDQISIEFLATDAGQVLNEMSTINESFGLYARPLEINTEVANALSNYQPINNKPTIGMDSFAYSRASTVYTIPVHESQELGVKIVSCFDFARRQVRLLREMEIMTCPILKQTISASLILDLVNLIENLFGLPNKVFRSKTFTQMSIEYQFKGFQILEKLAEAIAIHQDSLDELLEIRNKACAHYDMKTSIANTIKLLDNIDYHALEKDFDFLWEVFEDACKMDVRTLMYLIHDTPIGGILSVKPNGTEKSFL